MNIKKSMLLISVTTISLFLMSVTSFSTESESLDTLRQKFESMAIKDLSEEDKQQLWNRHLIDESIPLIHRSITTYSQTYQKRKILIGSGHKGQHGGRRFGFNNDLSWYAIDTGIEHEPDALLNVFNPNHLEYFGKNFADEIYVDWPVLVTESKNTEGTAEGNIRYLQAILKPGGSLYFKRNPADDSMSKPNIIISYADDNFMSESGRYGYPLTKKNFEIVKGAMGRLIHPEQRARAKTIKAPDESDEEIIQKFEENVLIKAKEYYREFGFSSVALYGHDAYGFKLTKSKINQEMFIKIGEKKPQPVVETSPPKKGARDVYHSHSVPQEEPINFYKEAVFSDIVRKFQLHFDETKVHGQYNVELSYILYQSASKLMNRWKEKGQLHPQIVTYLESSNMQFISEITNSQIKIKSLEEALELYIKKYKESEKTSEENDTAKQLYLKDVREKKREISSIRTQMWHAQTNINFNKDRLKGIYASSEEVFFPDFSNVSYTVLATLKRSSEQLYVNLDYNVNGCTPHSTIAETQDLITTVKEKIEEIGVNTLIEIITFANNGSYENTFKSVYSELGFFPEYSPYRYPGYFYPGTQKLLSRSPILS